MLCYEKRLTLYLFVDHKVLEELVADFSSRDNKAFDPSKVLVMATNNIVSPLVRINTSIII
jgi:hypothetical protein